MFRFLQRILNTCLQKLRDLLGIGKQEEISHKTESRSNSAHSLTSKEIIVLPDDIEFISFETEPLPHHPSPEELLRQEIETARAILGSVDGKTLDDQQMRCVIDSSPRQLVIAGAGTGKTTTIIGKVMYLLKTESVSPSEIAIFSYTNPSAREIRDRIQKATNSRIYAATFHSFASKIIATVEGTIRNITQNATDQFIKERFVPSKLSEEQKQLLCKYVLYGGEHLRSEGDFEFYAEYQAYLDRHLGTSPYASVGSIFISNYLAIHGIAHYYYKKTDNFLLTGSDIFIQYDPFHINGRWPTCFYEDHRALQEKYRTLEQQRISYQNEHTIVIRCHSNQLSDGTLEAYLTRELSRHGIQPVPRHSAELWPLAFPSDGKELSKIQTTVCNILSLMHGNNYSAQDLLSLASSAGLTRHNNHYILHLIESLYLSYRQYLTKNHFTTFDDLIFTAIDYLDKGKYKNPFKYIIVDEYQDIAPSRVTFLQALIRSSPAHLLCVGDDWQSIYGFNGSNVGFILNFEKFWGNATVNKIEKTYRFSQSLVDILGAFVMANPHQVKKQIRGHTNLQGCAIRVLFADEKNPLHNIIAQTLEGFPINSTVFLIGRFQKDLDTIVNERDFFETTIDKEITSITYCRRTDLRIRFLTAHASKGLEADNVIIINAKDGMFGFPSKIPNHPLVDLLQGQQHLYPYDEERRLFYVAATRTRNRTYIVCERSNKSAFVNEIINKYPDVLDSNNHICPLCGAPLIEVEDLLGNDWACKNYSDGTCNYRRDSVWMPPRKS